MARITIEQAALTDPRYQKLGRLLKKDRYFSIGCMVFVWNQCQEQETYFLTEEEFLDIFPEIKGLSQAIIEANLAEKMDDGRIRIKGTKGRIEWLKKKRDNGKYGYMGKEFGELGGRPPKNPHEGDNNNPHTDDGPNPPPAPAPAPAPAEKEKDKKEKSPRQAGLTYSPPFLEFYRFYPGPRKHGRIKPYGAWKNALKVHGLSEDELLRLCTEALTWQIKSEDWTKENGQYIPAPEVYLNGARWEQEPYDPKEAAKKAAKIKDQQILAELKERGAL